MQTYFTLPSLLREVQSFAKLWWRYQLQLHLKMFFHLDVVVVDVVLHIDWTDSDTVHGVLDRDEQDTVQMMMLWLVSHQRRELTAKLIVTRRISPRLPSPGVFPKTRRWREVLRESCWHWCWWFWWRCCWWCWWWWSYGETILSMWSKIWTSCMTLTFRCVLRVTWAVDTDQHWCVQCTAVFSGHEWIINTALTFSLHLKGVKNWKNIAD